MPVRRLLCIAASASLLVGVAACGPDDADEPPTASGSQSSDGGGTSTEKSTSSTPSEDASSTTDGDDQGTAAGADVPEPDPADFPGMDKHTDKGAEQAFRYYWAMVTWAYQTGETKVLSTLYDERCGNCASNVDAIERLKKREEYWSPAKLRDVKLEVSQSSTYELEVSYVFVLAAHTEPGKSGEGPVKTDASRVDSSGGLRWINGRWIVLGVALSTTPEKK